MLTFDEHISHKNLQPLVFIKRRENAQIKRFAK